MQSNAAISPTDFAALVCDLNAGIFAQQIGHALSDVAASVCATGKKGRVAITFDLAQIGDSNQVAIKHKLSHLRPMHKGKATEEQTTETAMYVGRSGKLTISPDTQTKFEFAGDRTAKAGE